MSTAPFDLCRPAKVQIADSEDVDPSPRRSIKRSADSAIVPTPETEPTARPRTSARRSLAQRNAAAESEDDDASASTATELTPRPSTLRSPDTDVPASDTSPASSPERKIWMRACNDCGYELHVRRTRCTSCGAVQMSKRAFAAAREEKQRTEVSPQDEACVTEAKQVRVTAEAQEAASQLALISEASGDSAAQAVDEAGVAPSTTSVAPAATSSVVSALARLTPEQLTKLRRMQKLRVLLNKLPSGVQLPPRPSEQQREAAVPPAPSDAISMLASVACM